MPLGIPHSTFLDWDELDQEKALAYVRETAKVCGGCGTRREEWDADRNAYVKEEQRCPGCEILQQGHEDIPSSEKGVKLYLVPRTVVEARIAMGLEG